MTEQGFATTLRVMNQLKTEGVIEDYAIGGGVGTIKYTEPFSTYNLDLFVIVPKSKGLTLLTPIYDRFRQLGYPWHKDYLIVEGLPVQFIAADELESEAVTRAARATVFGVSTKVMRPEYLIALFARAGRTKDKAKITMLLEQAKVDILVLREILVRYGLLEKFEAI